MMPKLPTFTTYDDKLNAIMFAKQIAEACAAICDHNTDYVSANAIREAAKEIGTTPPSDFTRMDWPHK